MYIKRCDVKPEKWARYKYNLTTNLGVNGTRLTGCEAHIALSKAVAEEGMVLLENNGLLPLREGTTVALFGVGSLDFVKGGGCFRHTPATCMRALRQKPPGSVFMSRFHSIITIMP